MSNPFPRNVYHALSRTSGAVDAWAKHPDGKLLWRLRDHWFFAEDCTIQ